MKVAKLEDKSKLYRVFSDDDEARVPKGKLGILSNAAYVTVDMTVGGRSLVTAYKKFTQAVNQAVADDVLPKSYSEFTQADSMAVEDIAALFSMQCKDIHCELEDNTDINGGFYLKCAVSKEYFVQTQEKPCGTLELMPVQDAGAIQSTEKTFDDVINLWFSSDAMFRVREQSKKSYRKSLRAFREWCAAQNVIQPTKDDVKNWCKAMDAEGLSTATKNLRLTTLRNFYKWLSSEYGFPNIAENLKGWKETKEHRRGFLSCDEMKRLMDSVEPTTQKRLEQAKTQSNRNRILLQGKRDKAVLSVLLVGGLRTIEINRLRVGDVTHKGGVCYLNVIGKGRDDGEDVKISRKAEQLIQEWLNAREKIDIVSDDSPLFCSLGNNSYGEPLSSNSVSTLCKEYLEAAGLKTKEIVAHSLRHSLATNSLLKGATLQNVQQQLRHASLVTTQVYLHEAEKAKNPCTDLISDEIF